MVGISPRRLFFDILPNLSPNGRLRLGISIISLLMRRPGL
ncbi:hypothetical protein MC7420_1769 [Coleofasciculus chthonoplastes PCC 7420]|uniref:Uncharacterized protein n=1 Tax=Coleofasciculus chthonoplastes PCC 7420 TaxID=118168 RepID=B4VMN6_9CYAN|nr:hypothetical protein MC7420_1769 [Coleofasciculus chthonoplastes PCC 7420]